MAKEVKNSSCQVGCTTGGCKIGLLILHGFFSIVYAITIHRVFYGPEIPVAKPQGKVLGPMKYLTIWDLQIQFLISIVNLLVVLTNCKRLISLRNTVHHGLSVPFGVIVSALFWTLFMIDRNLVFPKELDAIIPPHVNHILHSLVGINPLLNELLMYNERKSYHFYAFFAVFTIYLCQLLFIGYYLDYWVYPVFEVLNNSGRALFLVGCIVFGILLYLTHGAFHGYLWAKQIKDSKKKKV